MIVYERTMDGTLISHEEPLDCIVHAPGGDIKCTRLGFKYVPTGFGYALTPVFACREEDCEDLKEFIG